jgi:hypothetical protein
VTGAGGLNLTPDPTYANNVNAGTATASYSYAGDANHEPSLDSETFVITPMVVAVGGSFTVVEKVYDGTATATIEVNELTLLTPVAGDDVALSPVAVFDSADVGAGKVATLTAATTLTGADAGNYTLSLDGAPTTTGSILFPAVVAQQSCTSGYRSPSLGATVVNNSFDCPDGATLTSLTWTPTLLPGWSIHSVSGDGGPTTDGASIVFTDLASAPDPLVFAYSFAIPGGAPATNVIAAQASFGLSGMSGTLSVAAQPEAIVIRKYHSADTRTSFMLMVPNWAIDSFEVNRVALYWRSADGYHVVDSSPETPDGFDTGAGPTPWHHSADYQTTPLNQAPNGRIDTFEMNRVYMYWRALNGQYQGTNVTTSTPDGYDVRNP